MQGIANIAVKASIEKVWETVSDLEAFIRLIPETREFSYTSEQHRDVGASWSDTAELVGGVIDTEGTVTHWEERKGIAARFSTLRRGARRPNNGSWIISLAPLPNGTNLRYVFSMDGGPGLLLLPLLPLMNMSLRRVAKRTLRKVKEAIDTKVKGSS